MNVRPTIVLTSGVWDTLHRGHLNILWGSKQLGDILIVGVVYDASYKNVEPTQDFSQRHHAIQGLPCVDYAAFQQGTDPSDLIERFRPDLFTHGSDWDELIEGNETLALHGVQYVTLPYTQGISSTIVRGEA